MLDRRPFIVIIAQKNGMVSYSNPQPKCYEKTTLIRINHLKLKAVREHPEKRALTAMNSCNQRREGMKCADSPVKEER